MGLGSLKELAADAGGVETHGAIAEHREKVQGDATAAGTGQLCHACTISQAGISTIAFPLRLKSASSDPKC